MASELIEIPATILRGGTSRGVFLLEDDLPTDRSLWGPYLLGLFGSRDVRQIDGLGGADQLTSKCCIVGRHPDPEIDVTYTFAQIGIGDSRVHWDMNCGNLSASVGTFAILAGLVAPTEPETSVRVYQTNTKKLLKVNVPVGGGAPLVDGPLAIDGVPGTGAPVDIDFAKTAGASLASGLLPTGNAIDRIDVPGIGAVDCSIVDLANMCLFFRAEDAGFGGVEGPSEESRMSPVFAAIRSAAQELLGSDRERLTPWPISVAAPQAYTTLNGDSVDPERYDFAARLVATSEMHKAYPGTGGCCTAVAAVTPGTVVNQLFARSARPGSGEDGMVVVGHPSGTMAFGAEVHDEGGAWVVDVATFQRTARLIMRGDAYISRSEVDLLLTTIGEDEPTRSGVPEPVATAAVGGVR